MCSLHRPRLVWQTCPATIQTASQAFMPDGSTMAARIPQTTLLPLNRIAMVLSRLLLSVLAPQTVARWTRLVRLVEVVDVGSWWSYKARLLVSPSFVPACGLLFVCYSRHRPHGASEGAAMGRDVRVSDGVFDLS